MGVHWVSESYEDFLKKPFEIEFQNQLFQRRESDMNHNISFVNPDTNDVITCKNDGPMKVRNQADDSLMKITKTFADVIINHNTLLFAYKTKLLSKFTFKNNPY